MFTKKDLWFSVFTGMGTGLIAWRILEFLNVPKVLIIPGISGSYNVCGITGQCQTYYDGTPWSILIVIVPILWILGVNLGYFLGRWFSFFNQFGKFAAIGFTNAAVDFGILNLFIAYTGIAAGVSYSVFKATSFFIAMINSYFLNKHWAFNAGQNGASKVEFAKFTGVAVAAGLVNVGIASAVVNFVDPIFGFSSAVWANVGAAIGSASALVFSFIGFRFLVFKTSRSV